LPLVCETSCQIADYALRTRRCAAGSRRCAPGPADVARWSAPDRAAACSPSCSWYHVPAGRASPRSRARIRGGRPAPRSPAPSDVLGFLARRVSTFAALRVRSTGSLADGPPAGPPGLTARAPCSALWCWPVPQCPDAAIGCRSARALPDRRRAFRRPGRLAWCDLCRGRRPYVPGCSGSLTWHVPGADVLVSLIVGGAPDRAANGT